MNEIRNDAFNETTENKKLFKFKRNFSSKFLQLFAIIIAIIIVFLIFFSEFDFFDKPTTNSKTINSFQDYVYGIEKKVEETIANLEGVGKVSVSITFESSIEKKYAYESVTETSNGITTEELLLYKGEPIVINEIMPEIKGVVVVAKGASNAVVRLNIIRSIQILLGVTYDKIEVFNYKT